MGKDGCFTLPELSTLLLLQIQFPGQSVTMDKQYGTLSESLVVEPLLAKEVIELKSEIRYGKRMILLGLLFASVFCVATFAMVCVATEYSKEVVVLNSALVDKKTNTVLSTREHEEIIEDPLTHAGGVRWLTFHSQDGGITRAEVTGFEKLDCKVSETEDNKCVSGFYYIFKTSFGDYAASMGFNPDTLEATTSFVPVEADWVESVKAESSVPKSNAVASGYEVKA